MARIFISYRRDDNAAMTGRIYDRLQARFGRKNIFMDIDTIPLGVDFRDHLHRAVGQCDVLLAVIGGRWFGRTAEGGRRLDDPGDFVRIEVEAALARGIPVIPILVDHVTMPAKTDLPASLAALAFRNAIVVDHGLDFNVHVDRLIRGIEQLSQGPWWRSVLGVLRPGPSPPSPAGNPEPLPTATTRPAAVPESGPAQPRPTLPAKPQPVVVAPAAVAVEPGHSITNSLGMKLVLIPAGEFLMGSPDSDKDALAHEKPQHRVRITQSFHLGATPVTQGQYLAVTGANPSQFKGSDDLPVEMVSWHEAIAFCNKLSEREGLKPFHQFGAGAQSGGEGYRLLTEAEWEYACRAGSPTRFSFGDDAASLGEYAWFLGNSENKTHPVGQKRPNAWGLYDMHGNVWEWCEDWFEANYYANSPGADPLGPSQAAFRVNRGGSWHVYPPSARSAYRAGSSPGYRYFNLGFRLARVQSGS